MKIAMIQSTASDSLQENLAQVLEGLDQSAGCDLAVLPEFWNTPFENAAILRHAGEWKQILALLQKKAAELHLWIVSGTLPVEENEKLYNRAFVISSSGEIISHTDKLHLLEVCTRHHHYREADVITPGNSLCVFDAPWGKTGVLICMDIRFPEAARLLGQECVLLVVCAGFNAAVGAKHWQPLLQARAIENELFVCGVNTGPAGYSGYTSWGHSMTVSPDGEIAAQADDDALCTICEINPEEAAVVRRRSPYWNLRRSDLYTLAWNGPSAVPCGAVSTVHTEDAASLEQKNDDSSCQTGIQEKE